MATNHSGGNIQPGLDLEEHDGNNNSKRVSLTTVYGGLPVVFSGNITLDPGSRTQIVGNVTLSNPNTYIGLVTTTLGLGDRYIGLTTTTLNGLVTTVNVGLTTLAPSPNFIGLVTTIPNIYISNGLSSLASIGTTTTQIVPSNSNRFSLILRNISNTTVFISMISPATTTGMYLRQDDTYETDHYRGAIFGVVGAGAGELRYLEELL